ncbi:MAG: exonuclease domain-containing protein [Pigmentiphaga sp.]|uniref:exonuclease domain-containing protein n=1 Tax=Pigmentiphaga sp. TaxID=1977564 RepID=UPI0029A5A48F|nr:exonuclease domain-containing protein [Pigmentiphaga sp.]MDX3907327.1 exonuclease domain-containing protein [Pigmentiphaga sp.]
MDTSPRLAFVDLETTGTTAQQDRITEIGIVQVDERGMREWSSLVNPGRPIPPAIQALTGISDAMVADAPAFAALADEIAARLEGRLFIAHNARFDQSFLREEFRRLERPFRPEVLCTVRLSRKLYPQHRYHNLDALIARHGLRFQARHRALDDARLLWHFWQVVQNEFPAWHIDDMVESLLGRVRWPEHLDPGLPDTLPDGHGVYVFYGPQDQALYVGRADRLRDKVLSHFQPARWKSAKARRLAEQVRRIEWMETGGTIGALLHENRLLRVLAPTHNRRPRSAIPPADPGWPYPGPVGIREARMIHVVERWQFLGSATSDEALHELLEAGHSECDYEVHRILRDRLNMVPLLKLGPPRH